MMGTRKRLMRDSTRIFCVTDFMNTPDFAVFAAEIHDLLNILRWIADGGQGCCAALHEARNTEECKLVCAPVVPGGYDKE